MNCDMTGDEKRKEIKFYFLQHFNRPSSLISKQHWMKTQSLIFLGPLTLGVPQYRALKRWSRLRSDSKLSCFTVRLYLDKKQVYFNSFTVTNKYGLYHLSNSTYIFVFEFLCKGFKLFSIIIVQGIYFICWVWNLFLNKDEK